MRRWRCTSRFDPWGKGVRTGPHRQFAKKHFHFGGKHAILYDRIGEMNSSGAARRLRNGQFCRFNSHPARGRNPIDLIPESAGHDDSTHTPQGDGNSCAHNIAIIIIRFNSPLARGRKPIPVDKDDNQAFGFNSHPARGQTNRRNFSALHRCSRKVPSVFLFIAPSFQPGMAAEPFSECKTETPETKGQSL